LNTILCFGELLIDFLNINQFQSEDIALNEFRQYPGGAPANVAAAIGKLGGSARFLGQVGDDQFGHFLRQSMKRYNVDTTFLFTHDHAPTPLAFVFLDEQNERSFEFYRTNSADILFNESQLVDGAFEHASIFHFCSNTLTDQSIFDVTINAIMKAKANGCLVSFDVNLRHNLWKDKKVDILRITAALKLADIVKVSKEESKWIVDNGFAMSDWLKSVSIIWQTDGGADIEIFTHNTVLTMPSKRVEVIDSTAAGDAFSGGLLLALSHLKLNSVQSGFLTRIPLNESDIRNVTHFASSCGAVAVSKLGALPSLPTMSELQQDWKFT